MIGMTVEEAIHVIKSNRPTSGYTMLCEALDMAVAALRKQEERENVWHDAKDNPPKKPGLYYGKRDDTDSMYLCQYRDGVWTLDAYPETRMHVIKWAYYNAFVQEQENEMVPKQDMETILHEVVNRAKPKWISVKDRLPLQSDPAQKVLFITKTGGIFIGCYYKATAYDQFNGWYSMCVRIDNVTHWMPLPEPPNNG